MTRILRGSQPTCRAGHALVLAAAEWPRSRFVGYQLDERALELARRRAAERGVGKQWGRATVPT